LSDRNFIVQLPSRIIYGEATAEKIPSLVQEFGVKSALIVTDPVVHKVGLSDRIETLLKKVGIKTEIFDRVEPEPKIQVAEEVAKFARKSHCGLVIGIGGGSSLDMAKVASIAETNAGPMVELIGVDKVPRAGIPKILIPTTSGTGSEVTMNSIVSLEEEALKTGIVSRHLMADVAVVDPLMTVSMPPKITASTGLDALSHAIEAIMSVDANSFSQPLALESIRLIFNNLQEVREKGDDLAARGSMSLASLNGGIAIQVSGTCGGHAAAYAFAVKAKTPHGVSCAIALPYIMEFNAPKCLHKLAVIAEAAGVSKPGQNPEEAAFKAVEAVRNLTQMLDNPLSLKEIGVKEKMVPLLARDIMKSQRLLVRNPRVFTEGDAAELFIRMYEGRPLPMAEYRKQ
jgi:alcohol dehydrogenase class IV